MVLGLVRDIGAMVKVVIGNRPLNNAAGTRNGASIDRLGYQSCVLVAHAGVEEGAPSARTLDAKVQDSPDGSTAWADYNPSGAGSGAITQITAVSTDGEKNIDLSGAKRYIRVVEVVGFTGGTTPKLNSVEYVILGGADTLPA